MTLDSTPLLYAFKPIGLALLQPPLPFLVLMVLGAGHLCRRRKLGRALLLTGFLASWLSCTEVVGQLLARHWLQTPEVLSTARLAELKAESERSQQLAVLVLGGGIRQFVPEYGSSRPNDISQQRLLFGVWLSRQLQAPLAYSGGIGWTAKRQVDTEAAVADQFVQGEMGRSLRWQEDQAKDTQENAALSVPMLKADGVKTHVLVTHDLHMPRAMQAFQREAGDAMTLVAAPVGQRNYVGSAWQDWMPSATGLGRVRYAVYEGLALMAGH